MAGSAGLYFVIVNNDRARFVRPGPDNRLHTIKTVDRAVLRKRDNDLARVTTARGPPVPDHVRFVHLVAERIKEDLAVDLFDHLVLVAPPEVLHDLAAMIDGPASARVIGSVPGDLANTPDPELPPHLETWLSCD